MRILAKKTLRAFWTAHRQAEEPLKKWHADLKKISPRSFADLKKTFGSADSVKGYVVFDIGGNKYRLVADVVYVIQIVFIQQVLTHKEYDQWTP